MNITTNRTFTIAEIKNIITPIAESHGVAKVYLFGSYARGNATANSDIDLWIERGKVRTLFALGGLYADLEEGLMKSIDIITDDAMCEKFHKNIENEEIIIYG